MIMGLDWTGLDLSRSSVYL